MAALDAAIYGYLRKKDVDGRLKPVGSMITLASPAFE